MSAPHDFVLFVVLGFLVLLGAWFIFWMIIDAIREEPLRDETHQLLRSFDAHTTKAEATRESLLRVKTEAIILTETTNPGDKGRENKR